MAYRTIEGVPVWGTPLEEAVRQIGVCQQTATQSALMADHHVGYSMPIGGVCTYADKISPSGIGYDISCGNKAVRTDAPAAEITANIETVMDDVWRTISFGIGRKNLDLHHESVELRFRQGIGAFELEGVLGSNPQSGGGAGYCAHPVPGHGATTTNCWPPPRIC